MVCVCICVCVDTVSVKEDLTGKRKRTGVSELERRLLIGVRILKISIGSSFIIFSFFDYPSSEPSTIVRRTGPAISGRSKVVLKNRNGPVPPTPGNLSTVGNEHLYQGKVSDTST